MTLALLVAFAAIPSWLAILSIRWALVRPTTRATNGRAALAALGLSGACVGGMYPLLWAMLGNLPSGVDEDDLLTVLVIGMVVLVGRAFADVAEALR